jgi:CHAT domain
MTASVRIEVTTTRTQDGDWLFSMRCPTREWQATRSAPAFAEEPHYPKPQLPCCENCDHKLCSDADAATVDLVLRQLANRQITGEVVERLGRYLFDTLLGPEWTVMRAWADRLDCDVVELALMWPYEQGGDAAGPSCTALAQLPWELMRDEQNRNLAAAGDGVGIAVTRVIANAQYPARKFSVPPKVLFVVGATLSDRSVRAGAEMLALLREVREAGCRVRYRILENTTPARLKAAMSGFRPDIVHFISHGSVRNGRGQLELKSDTGRPELWPAERLLQNLRMGRHRRLPPLVVLSACDSAGALIYGSRVAAPLAAELVHGGIPVVVAMAGTVSDRACRVFTRYFGRALAAGESLVAATAQARERAFAETTSGADWALPTVFFSAGVDANEIRRSDDRAAKDFDTLTDNARWSQIPVFCARENFLQAFWAMIGDEPTTGWEVRPGTRSSVLAVCARAGQSGVGKTRLLEELARQALLGGHLPLVIGANDENPPPGDVRGLAKGLASEMQRFGKKILETDISLGAELNRFSRRDPTKSPDEDGEWSPSEEVAELAEGLEQDSAELRRAAIDRYPRLFTEGSRIVVLIDELGVTSDPLLTQLFDHDNGLNHNGLGSNQHPVPVVLVVLTDDKPGIRTDLLTGSKSETWLVSRELLEFNEDGEDMLAYELVLLNPWRSGGDEQLRQRWIFDRTNGQAGPAKHARIALKGKPAHFVDHHYELFINYGVLYNVLADANDGDTPVGALR